MTFRHQHPVYIFKSTVKYIGLLIFPILRAAAVLYMTGLNWRSYLRGVWMDILVVVFIVLLGILRWYVCMYALGEDGVYYKSGIIVRTNRMIPYKNISILSVEKIFYLMPFRAVKVCINTDGGFPVKHYIDIIIRKKYLNEVKTACSAPFGGDGIKRQYIPKNLMVILLSIITSNTITGVMFAATLIAGTGRVLGKTVEKLMFENLTKLAIFFAADIPPIAAIIAFIIMGGWFISFSMNLIRHLGFSVTRDNELLLIEGGIVTKREYMIAIKRINLLELRQSIIMKLFGFYTVLIHVNGYGKNKYELSVLMPAGDVEEIIRSLRLVLPEIPICDKKIKTKKKYLSRFLVPPISWLLGVSAAWILMYLLFPKWRMLVLFIGIMAEIPCVWFLIVKIVSFFHTGIGERMDAYTFCYTYGYRIKTVSVPRRRIITVRIRQSLFQKMSGCCDVVIKSYSQGRKRHVIPNLELSEAARIMNVEKWFCK